MSKENGFLPLRRGIWEHVRDGRMSITEALAFIYICSQADTRTGIWKGSAGALVGEIGVKARTARDVLEKMEHGDYIRRFAVPGRHICYPILIHKFPITQGEHDGEHLNALASASSVDLAYFPREQSVEQDGEHGVKHGAAQRRIEKLEGRQEKKTKAKPAAKSPRPADPRYQSFVDFAYKTFEAKHGQAPCWDEKHFANLKALLEKYQNLTQTELQRRWSNYLASTEAFTVKQGCSLAYFCSKPDAFISGPITEKGKPDAQDTLARTVAASGLDENGRLIVH